MKIPQLRLLPTTLAVAAMVLPLKIAAVWHGFTPGIEAVHAEAKETKPAKAQPAPHAAAAVPPAGAPEVTSAPPATEAAPAAPAAPASPLAGLLPGDKMPLTQTEIDLLQKLQARRDALDARERQLDMRENLVKAAEKSLQSKSDEIAKQQAKSEDVAKPDAETAAEPNLDGVVSIYEKMKPKDAARILNDMDMDLLSAVIAGMKEAKVAPILAEMDAAKARSLTARLAERKSAPKAGS